MLPPADQPPNSTDHAAFTEIPPNSGPAHPGELWVCGPNIMKRYWRNPEATRATLTPDGWLRTGDIAFIDEDGRFYIVDRIKVRGAAKVERTFFSLDLLAALPTLHILSDTFYPWSSMLLIACFRTYLSTHPLLVSPLRLISSWSICPIKFWQSPCCLVNSALALISLTLR